MWSAYTLTRITVVDTLPLLVFNNHHHVHSLTYRHSRYVTFVFFVLPKIISDLFIKMSWSAQFVSRSIPTWINPKSGTNATTKCKIDLKITQLNAQGHGCAWDHLSSTLVPCILRNKTRLRGWCLLSVMNKSCPTIHLCNNI